MCMRRVTKTNSQASSVKFSTYTMKKDEVYVISVQLGTDPEGDSSCFGIYQHKKLFG